MTRSLWPAGRSGGSGDKPPPVDGSGFALRAFSNPATAPPRPGVTGLANPLRAPVLGCSLKHLDSSKRTVHETEDGGQDGRDDFSASQLHCGGAECLDLREREGQMTVRERGRRKGETEWKREKNKGTPMEGEKEQREYMERGQVEGSRESEKRKENDAPDAVLK